mgnify:CR=1 FL=1
MASALLGGIAGYMTSQKPNARAEGKREAEFEALKKTVEQRDEVVHNRISKMQTEFNVQLSELNARTIEVLKQGSKLEGIILGKGAK